MEWLEVEIVPDGEQEREVCLALLSELDTLGIEETERRLTAYFPPHRREAVSKKLNALSTTPAFRLVEHDPDRWLVSYRESFRGFAVSTGIYVHPSWDAPSPDHAINLLIDPGHGFGTGTHESTQLILRLLPSLATDAASVLDVGTGSGILALAVTRLRPSARVVALDTAYQAVEAARETLMNNNVTGVDLLNGPVDAVAGRFELVMANLTGPILTRLAGALQGRTDRWLVISGFTLEEEDGVLDRFDFRPKQRSELRGWVSHVLERKG